MCVRVIRPRQLAIEEALSASPATMLRLVIEVEMFCAIAHFLSDGDRLRSEHALPPGCEVPQRLMARGLERFPPQRHSAPPFGRTSDGILVSEFARDGAQGVHSAREQSANGRQHVGER